MNSLKPVSPKFFDKKSPELAPALLGKVLVRRLARGKILACMIVETEAYEHNDRASHSYRQRKGCEAMFEAAGTLYMYKLRQWHSLNISSGCHGGGVLLKGACPYPAPAPISTLASVPASAKHLASTNKTIIDTKRSANTNKAPADSNASARLHKTTAKRPTKSQIDRRFSGQGKLCHELGLETPDWNGKRFTDKLYLADIGYKPKNILVTPRLNVIADRHLLYRFIDLDYLPYATLPSIKRTWQETNQTKIRSNPRSSQKNL